MEEFHAEVTGQVRENSQLRKFAAWLTKKLPRNTSVNLEQCVAAKKMFDLAVKIQKAVEEMSKVPSETSSFIENRRLSTTMKAENVYGDFFEVKDHHHKKVLKILQHGMSICFDM